MELKYRGVTYNYNPTIVEAEEGKVGGKYRGLEWRFRNQKKPSAQKPTLDLVYRGVHYKTGGENTGSVKPAIQPETAQTPSLQEKARALFLKDELKKLNRQQSMFNRTADEVGIAH
ncbi:DUF4278 domain-containing protein [Spirulina sp. CS-785/01]|uniref:DUF4278 domain-containing protein n=1 Tax=Spirulina sp. CS-785/01 TaxID=3021716 RepID=UPI00232F2B2E|nr:DUF4278 domain-containing protein [Spirulina sp. CS-785/01]MDB9314451.1 DUF4278 domain-containing protein [Spirulina sp. CS-785/01]